ncbi:hypothetical protein BB558_004660 [Smittium angustum]|nr:hypothetical protein BB558_004660 [Smittium angustum]
MKVPENISLHTNTENFMQGKVIDSLYENLGNCEEITGEKLCILYLEPRKTSALYKAIELFFEKSKEIYGPNEAHVYHPHCSMTGFFTVNDFSFNESLLNNIPAELSNLYKENFSGKLPSSYQIASLVLFVDEFITRERLSEKVAINPHIVSKIQIAKSDLDENTKKLELILEPPRSIIKLPNFMKMTFKHQSVDLRVLEFIYGKYPKSKLHPLNNVKQSLLKKSNSSVNFIPQNNLNESKNLYVNGIVTDKNMIKDQITLEKKYSLLNTRNSVKNQRNHYHHHHAHKGKIYNPSKNCIVYTNGIHIRNKQVNHISLAYTNKHVKTEKKLSDEELKGLYELADSIIMKNKEAFESVEWDICLYVVNKTQTLEKKHSFNEVYRWRL